MRTLGKGIFWNYKIKSDVYTVGIMFLQRQRRITVPGANDGRHDAVVPRGHRQRAGQQSQSGQAWLPHQKHTESRQSSAQQTARQHVSLCSVPCGQNFVS